MATSILLHLTSFRLQLLILHIIFQILVSCDCGSFDKSCCFQFSYWLMLYFIFEMLYVFSIFHSITESRPIPDHWPLKTECISLIITVIKIKILVHTYLCLYWQSLLHRWLNRWLFQPSWLSSMLKKKAQWIHCIQTDADTNYNAMVELSKKGIQKVKIFMPTNVQEYSYMIEELLKKVQENLWG